MHLCICVHVHEPYLCVVSLSQVIIKWEFQRVRESQDSDSDSMDHEPSQREPGISLGMKRSASDGTAESKRQRTQTQVADPNWALETEEKHREEWVMVEGCSRGLKVG